ncbi:unnamed protein product [Photorhabdus laumondii subsp. laumondii TTO1]|uniref:Photorhabdus luminescens subsp. laumondii TTO1 complete genome segment 7/17 n=1 Tax=Photorhabdus laumondii subsp. laumondii (strain DSM 15139 / CIP 105565 / TT01) TaxID=243265 RepID=Q7N5B7_PHOLL|nr:unnamed protein product [Photorhabdus laumondii subsp. laumondii TTO1]
MLSSIIILLPSGEEECFQIVTSLPDSSWMYQYHGSQINNGYYDVKSLAYIKSYYSMN